MAHYYAFKTDLKRSYSLQVPSRLLPSFPLVHLLSLIAFDIDFAVSLIDSLCFSRKTTSFYSFFIGVISKTMILSMIY